MSHQNLELQLDWDVRKLHEHWQRTPDNAFLLYRLSDLSSSVTAAGAVGRVLEIAASEAIHACKLSLHGLETFVVEPSPVMLARARERMAEYGARLTLVRGVAETLPFADRTFDRVLIDSAIDHLGQPERSLEEMSRVLAPDGRLVITFVNYQSLSTRVSRFLYRVARRLSLASRDEHFFWDSPVPVEHTFECTYDLLLRICRPTLELDHVFGVSIGWMVPGWGACLRSLSQQRSFDLLQRLDRLAYRRPRLADFVVTVWKPRGNGAQSATVGNRRTPSGDQVVRPTDVVYPGKLRAEADHWAQVDFGGGFFSLVRGGDQVINQAYTGDPTRSWIDDLLARGPFETAAELGCDEEAHERYWLERHGSRRLDVYELSAGVIRQKRAGLGLRLRAPFGPWQRIRFVQTDLNTVHLPTAQYDVIWSSGCTHHIVNLEHVFAEVERALRPGGLFAIRDYVGERRMQFDSERLARINQVLRQVPAKYRRVDAVTAPPLQSGDEVLGLSPCCAVRSDVIVPLAVARFDVVHKGVTGALFPLDFAVDLAALEREAPEVLMQLQAAEQAALRAPDARPCGIYLVLRKREPA